MRQHAGGLIATSSFVLSEIAAHNWMLSHVGLLCYNLKCLGDICVHRMTQLPVFDGVTAEKPYLSCRLQGTCSGVSMAVQSALFQFSAAALRFESKGASI